MVMMFAGKALSLAAVDVGSPRRGGAASRALAVQVVMKSPKMFWVTKPIITRNVPVTAVRPTARLAEMRHYVATHASNWRGATGAATLQYDSRSKKHKAGDLVLAVQAAFQKTIKGADAALKNPRAATWDATAGKYRTYQVYRVHTPEELAKIAGLRP
jgi:hypothetical protein